MKEDITISVVSISGPICVDPEDAWKLCGLLREHLQRAKGIVCLDFTGVEVLTSAFLNGSLGCLHATFSADYLCSALTVKGLEQPDSALVDLIRRSAAEYFSKSPEERAVVDNAADRLALSPC
jgi:hypothetical protein